ncbi:hypothetical protein DPMN_173849 [Dreissena polymorpha]|uniref:Uncharacterized protein n=1 Tax=Dreissena polymorpha TaxID=45954 RepID=A0A9D4E2C9_DREPO|nr:hypothetical protein DPMN_173849 [Dreissena polymorpha]
MVPLLFLDTNYYEAKLCEQLDDDSEEVLTSEMIDRYAARPDSLVDLCLADFASWTTGSQIQMIHIPQLWQMEIIMN